MYHVSLTWASSGTLNGFCVTMTSYDVMEEYSARSGNWCFERFLNPLPQNHVIEEYFGASRVIVHKSIVHRI